MRRLRYTRLARRDLESITDHISADNPQRALTFVDELEERAAKAAEQPMLFPARDDIRPGLRAAPHGAYRILFRTSPGEVVVVRVVHSAQDLKRVTLD
jgi:toxin ParE1/3/4